MQRTSSKPIERFHKNLQTKKEIWAQWIASRFSCILIHCTFLFFLASLQRASLRVSFNCISRFVLGTWIDIWQQFSLTERLIYTHNINDLSYSWFKSSSIGYFSSIRIVNTCCIYRLTYYLELNIIKYYCQIVDK